jgi:hypothetical protein
MPAENAGSGDGPSLRYLKARQSLDRKFPGFGHDIHGVEPQADGTYQLRPTTRMRGTARLAAGYGAVSCLPGPR